MCMLDVPPTAADFFLLHLYLVRMCSFYVKVKGKGLTLAIAPLI